MFESREAEFSEAMSAGAVAGLVGPGCVDQGIRAMVQACWMSLPAEKRSAPEVDKQIRRIVDRALADFADDVKVFGALDRSKEGHEW